MSHPVFFIDLELMQFSFSVCPALPWSTANLAEFGLGRGRGGQTLELSNRSQQNVVVDLIGHPVR